MKVKELIKALKVFNQELEVYVSSDTEGNSFASIAEDTIYSIGSKFIVIYPYEEYINPWEIHNEHNWCRIYE